MILTTHLTKNSNSGCIKNHYKSIRKKDTKRDINERENRNGLITYQDVSTSREIQHKKTTTMKYDLIPI